MGTLLRKSLWLLVAFFTAWNAPVATAMPPTHQVLTITPSSEKESDSPSPLRLEFVEGENGLKAGLRFTAPPAKKEKEPDHGDAGGDYQLFLDDLPVTGGSYKGTEMDVAHDIPVITLRNGEHHLRGELRAPSGEMYKAEVSFIFDGSPSITLAEPMVDKAGLLDAEVTVGFFGGTAELAGFIEVLIDQRPWASIQVKPDRADDKTTLSQLNGTPLTVAQLASGTHLLTLRASGVNGNTTVLHRTFTVATIPSLEISRDKNGELLEAKAGFVKSPEGYSGTVEVFWRQDLFLVKREEGARITITRAELDEALKKNRQVVPETSSSLVFALRAANGAEHWQVVEPRPQGL